MKKLYGRLSSSRAGAFALLMLMAPIAVPASEPADSVGGAPYSGLEALTDEQVDSVLRTISLKEVTVAARTAIPVKNGVAYVPAQRLKKSSFDAYRLLRAMQIGDVVVDVGSNSVETPTRVPYVFFLNGLEASGYEIANLRTSDIQAVEVLHRPVNPEFHGNEYVINIVAREYAYGGYSSLKGSQKFIANRGNYSGYSKLVKGPSTWQVNAEGGYDNTRSRQESGYKYCMADDEGHRWTLGREMDTEVGKRRSGNYSAAVQWRLRSSEKFNASVTAGVVGNRTPRLERVGSVRYAVDGEREADAMFSESSHMSSVSPTMQARLNIKPDERWYVSVSANASGAINESNDFQTETHGTQGPVPVEIHNRTREKVVAGGVAVSVYHVFGNGTQLGVSVADNASVYNTRYLGDALGHQRFVTNSTDVSATYSFNFNSNWSVGLSAGYSRMFTRQDGEKDIAENDASGSVNVSGSIGGKHMIRVSGDFTPMFVPAWAYNGMLTQSNAVVAQRGTPSGLKTMKRLGAMLSYYWLMSNKWRMLFGSSVYHTADLMVFDYVPYRNVMYEVPVTSGSGTYLSFNYSLDYNISSAWSAGVGASAWYVHQDGLYSQHRWKWRPEVSLSFNPNDHLQFYASLNGPFMQANNFTRGSYSYEPYWDFSVDGTYTLGNFSVEVEVNPFNRYLKRETRGNHPDATYRSDVYDGRFGRSVMVSLRYSFDYGKKVDRNDYLHIRGNTSTTVR